MKSIILIVPYIGKWPLWFEAHLVSIAKNPTVNWLFITDCELPKNYPNNVRFISISLESLNIKINTVLGIDVPLSPRKLCDVRPAYGEIFQEYISDYDFWGFCDVDIIWGNIRGYVSDDILSNYDIISSRKEAIAGHFTLFANKQIINTFYKTIPGYNELIKKTKYMWGEEQVLTRYLKLILSSKSSPKVYWKTYFVNNVNGKAHQEYYLDRWIWQEGKMINTKTGQEVMYLHFINWKRTMRYSEIQYKDNPNQFYISYSWMHYNLHHSLAHGWNWFTNLFDGYYVLLRRIRLERKIIRLKKRFINRLKQI